MDKLCQILNFIDHPERYSEDEVKAMLSDPETRELYNMIVDTDVALTCHEARPDVDEAWHRFCQNHKEARSSHAWHKAVAAAGLLLVMSGIALAAIFWSSKPTSAPGARQLRQTEASSFADTSRRDTAPARTAQATVVRTFENVTLEQMLSEISAAYGMQARFSNAGVRSLRIYYTWSSSMPLDSVVGELNRFEQFTVTVQGHTLVVE